MIVDNKERKEMDKHTKGGVFAIIYSIGGLILLALFDALFLGIILIPCGIYLILDKYFKYVVATKNEV